MNNDFFFCMVTSFCHCLEISFYSHGNFTTTTKFSIVKKKNNVGGGCSGRTLNLGIHSNDMSRSKYIYPTKKN